jgi:hypothetical protein
MIDFTTGEIVLGIVALLALAIMWRILTTDHPEDGQ